MARPGSLSPGWTVALGAALTLAVLAALPPVLGGDAGAVVRAAFAAVCHQIPDRSPHLGGEPLALCHRCWGVLLGLVAGLALAPALGARRLADVAGRAQARWLVAAALPTALDWALGAAGLWANTPASRGLTGALFGLVAGAILAANLLAVRRHPSSSPTLVT